MRTWLDFYTRMSAASLRMVEELWFLRPNGRGVTMNGRRTLVSTPKWARRHRGWSKNFDFYAQMGAASPRMVEERKLNQPELNRKTANSQETECLKNTRKKVQAPAVILEVYVFQ